MVKKSQEESEQPAKVYQLDAIEAQVAAVGREMTKGFSGVNTSIQALLIKSESQVTPQQFSDNLTALKTNLENQLTEEVKKIHLVYSPLKDNLKWMLRTVAIQAIVIAGQILFLIFTNVVGGG